jgi:peptidoglycan/xylan/chitin deacetylase (PgdA/CDA1 family)
MRWQNLVTKAIAEFYSLLQLPSTIPSGLRILIYHAVESPVYEDHLGLNTIKVNLFNEHIKLLSKMEVIPLLPLKIAQHKMQVVITFDDGYADNLKIAAPILAENNLPFTVFVTTEFIRNKKSGFLTPDELKELSLIPGVTIGSHTSTHPHLTSCNNEKLVGELEESKLYLEDLLGQAINAIAYPYGDVDMRVRDAALQAGYEVGTGSRVDINRIDRDHLMLNRCFILGSDSPRILNQKLKGGWDWYRWRNYDPLLKVNPSN